MAEVINMPDYTESLLLALKSGTLRSLTRQERIDLVAILESQLHEAVNSLDGIVNIDKVYPNMFNCYQQDSDWAAEWLSRNAQDLERQFTDGVNDMFNDWHRDCMTAYEEHLDAVQNGSDSKRYYSQF